MNRVHPQPLRARPPSSRLPAARRRRQLLDVNVAGTMNGTLAALELMRPANRGHVINIVSLAGLVAAPGETVYSATKHACLAFSIGTLGVIKRPDNGQMQLTDNSKPLYTFVRDSPGQLTGNGFHDQFGAHRFTWHVVLSSGAVALPAAQPTAKAPARSTSHSYGSPY